jgi:hypothetical protein
LRPIAVSTITGERLALIGEMREAVVPVLGNEPAPGRTQHLLSPLLFPLPDES